MENKDIIFKKEIKQHDYFSMILCLITLLILVFQVMADRHISQASRDFIEGAKAKRIAVREKARKAKQEKLLEEQRLLQQQEEAAYQSALEEQNRGKEVNKVEDIQNRMDYRQKLEIYRQSQTGIKQGK